MPDDAEAAFDLEQVRQVAEFRLALRQFHAISDRITRRCGLTPRQYLLLLTITAAAGERGHVSVGHIVAALALAEGTVTELIDRAERSGLVSRTPGVGDRRVYEVRITPTGQRRFAEAFEALARERQSLRSLIARLPHEVEG